MRLLEMATEGAIRVGISDPIIAEVQRVLLTKFGWSAERGAATESGTFEPCANRSVKGAPLGPPALIEREHGTGMPMSV